MRRWLVYGEVPSLGGFLHGKALDLGCPGREMVALASQATTHHSLASSCARRNLEAIADTSSGLKAIVAA
jgi:hypothetical protein